MSEYGVAKIPRTYIIVAISMVAALVATVYASAVNGSTANYQQTQSQIQEIQKKNEEQDAAISLQATNAAALSATVSAVLPQINSRLDRIDKKLDK